MSRREPRRLVVFTSQFPEPNETFIVREVAELARDGFAITVLSLRPPPAVINPPEARELLHLVWYPPRPGARSTTNAGVARRSMPLQTTRILRRAIRSRATSPSAMDAELTRYPSVTRSSSRSTKTRPHGRVR